MFKDQEVKFVPAEAREHRSLWTERTSLAVSKAVLRGVEVGDIDTILARNRAYTRHASGILSSSAKFMALLR